MLAAESVRFAAAGERGAGGEVPPPPGFVDVLPSQMAAAAHIGVFAHGIRMLKRFRTLTMVRLCGWLRLCGWICCVDGATGVDQDMASWPMICADTCADEADVLVTHTVRMSGRLP